MKKEKEFGLPTTEQLVAELQRVRYKNQHKSFLRTLICVLAVSVAAVVLMAFLLFPVFGIYGSSMSPTLNEGEIVAALKSSDFKCGDVVVLSFNNKILVKRVIASSGQWVDIDLDGNVSVDGKLIDEPYLMEKTFGDCDIVLPCQVPESGYFVMGDNRVFSQDSRNSAIGCIPEDQIVGRVVLRLWPLESFGALR